MNLFNFMLDTAEQVVDNWPTLIEEVVMNKQEIINEIKKSVTASAENVRMDAGYGGRMDDGGAANMEERLRYWLDGIAFAETGKTFVYQSTLQRIEKESDPEYLEFKRLQEKFGK